MADRKFHLGYFTKFGPPAWQATDSRTDGSDWSNGRYFVDLARRLDAACLDFLFFEDTLSVSEAVGGSRELDLKYALYAPKSDPIPLIPLLAHNTTGLGIIATCTTTFYPPWHVARLFSTVDGLSGGRVGFNVVTTSETTSAQNFGLDRMPSHADRYAKAAEFLDVVNGLWEGWEEDALLQDAETNTYVDATKVHALDHTGEYFRVRGPLNTPRSPQGRPLIAQAGGSDRGRDFASKYADLILAGAYGGPDEMKAFRDDIQQRVRGHGRNPDDVRVMFLTAVHFSDRPGATISDLTSDAKFEALVVQNASELDLDLSRFDPDGPFPMDLEPGGHTSIYDGMKLLGQQGMTFREVISTVGVGGSWQPIGTPEAIADELIQVMEYIGGDGVMLLANDVGRRPVHHQRHRAPRPGPATRRRHADRVSPGHAARQAAVVLRRAAGPPGFGDTHASQAP